MIGYSTRITSGGIGVLRYHYSADSNKRPGTPDGDQWIAEESKAYPQGMDDPRWKKEMEIQYGAMGGQFLFPRWEAWKTNGAIVIPTYDPIDCRLYGSYDHGWRNPSSFLVHAVDRTGDIVTLWEFYGSLVPAHQIAQIIKGYPGYGEDGTKYEGCPFPLQDLAFIVADPEIWKEDKPQLTGPNKSTAKIFRDLGVPLIQGDRGGDITVANWLHGYYWKDPLRPRYRILSSCPKLIWEIGQQRHKEFSAQVALKRSQPEELVDKDNHAWDALKYFIKKFPPPASATNPAHQPGTFAWARKQAIQRKRDPRTPIRTYRIDVA